MHENKAEDIVVLEARMYVETRVFRYRSVNRYVIRVTGSPRQC